MLTRTEGRSRCLAFALAVAVSSTLGACSLDFHRFVPPDGDADAVDAQIEAVATETTYRPSRQVIAPRAGLICSLAPATTRHTFTSSMLRPRSRAVAHLASRRPRAS